MTEAVAAVATAALQTYAAGSLAAFMDLLTDDVEYALYIDQADLPFAGETRGKEALRERIAQMHASFDYVLFRPLAVRVVDATTTHNQVEFMYRNKATGEMLSGRFRLVLTVEGGRVQRIEEYHDVARVKAFLRLVGGVQPD
jgi:ketosteroid isomerase-like protein